MEYNTARNYLVMREYGRHIQKMVEYLLSLEDREKRNTQAKSVIELMGFLNPHLKNVEDFKHMLWDHLFVISDFKLDVDSPYPIPAKDTYKPKGETMKYPRRYPKYPHLGKNLEIVIDKALKEENAEKKVGFANAIAYYMKLSYSNWHKELVHDDTIRNELDEITGGQLEFNNTLYIKHRNQNFERDDYQRNTSGARRQNFGSRKGNTNRPGGGNNPQQRDNRGNRPGGGNNPQQRDNRNSNNRNFKKRY